MTRPIHFPNGKRRRDPQPSFVGGVLVKLALAVLLYALVSLLAYNIRNPEMTQIQVYDNFVEALLWR